MSKRNQVVLVTGASSGIGKATARKLLADGHIVYGASRRIERMKDIENEGVNILRMDVTNDEDRQYCIDHIIKEEGRIDVLVNNAGFGLYGAVEDIPLDDARWQFEVNLFGLAGLVQLVLPYMRNQKYGKIINISSIGGKIYTPLGAWYYATKHALEGWSDALRLEVRQFGVHVVLIEPGLIRTEFADVMTEPMQRYSGHGPYADFVKKVINALGKSYSETNGSPPTIIADVIAKAIRSKKPKTRYRKGKMAGTLLFLRKWTSDRMFDRIVMSQVK
ncbi:MAG: oxidoreductase [Methanobacteriota archaeon]|nr:MAG: oxidoreductase [Euryarchaeota archaeon]